MTIDINTLLVRDTAAIVATRGLEVAQALGIPVSTWRTGDPTKSLYSFLARALAGVDGDPSEPGLAGLIVSYGQSAFLSLATGDWLTVLAHEVYGVDRVQATFATATVTLQNTLGGLFPIDPNNAVTLKSSASGKTYHTTDAFTLSAGLAHIYAVIADEAGSDSSEIANGIDTLVTALPGVVVLSSTAAVGVDEQSDFDLRVQCRATLGALSPNGPTDAYEFVARNSALTGVLDITRAKAIGDSATGNVTIYIAGSSGVVAGASLTAAQTAIERWATPLCITPTVANGTPVTINVTATISGVGIPAGYATAIASALGVAVSVFGIAGTGGDTVDTTLLTATIRETIPQIKIVAMTVPAAPVALAVGQFPVLGTVSITQV